MKLVRDGQAAMIAAIMVLTGNAARAQNAVRAQPGGVQYGDGSGIIYLSMKPECCKDGKCCKDGESCCDSRKCDAKCSCCKDNKCACCKDGECGGDKDKTVSTKSGCGCCPLLGKLAKKTAIILVMPASMPLPACCMEAMGMMPHPAMPAGPHVWMPPMMPHVALIPPTPSMGIGAPMMPPMPTVCAPPACAGGAPGYSGPCPDGNTVWAASQPSVAPCPTTKGLTIAAPAYFCTSTADANVRKETAENNDRVAICIGDDTCIRAKKMTITIGDTEITVSRFDNRVRIRGAELKATAACVRSDHKDNLILEGDVVLHCKKDGHAATYRGDRIELNLSSSTMKMTIERVSKTPSSQTSHTDEQPYSR